MISAILKESPPANKGTGICFVLIGFALWLATHTYAGIWHDARLYAVMAMRWLSPLAYANDPWFIFGSQDAYSVFSPLYAMVVSQLGLGEAARLLAFLGGLAFVGAACFFCASTLTQPYSHLAFLLLVTVPLPYCPSAVLNISESFVTARPWAVSASLLALACHMRGSRLAIAWHVVALMLHPLMAIGPLALSVSKVLRPTHLVLAIVALIGMTTVLALFGLGPLDIMGETWRTLVADTGVIVFMPVGHDVSPFVFAVAVIGLAIALGEKALRSWYSLALLVGGVGYLSSIVASNWYPSALIIQIQAWRALWLVAIFTVIASVDLLRFALCSSSPLRPFLLMIAIVGVLFRLDGAFFILIFTGLLLIFSGSCAQFSRNYLHTRWLRWLWGLMGFSILVQIPRIWIDFEIMGRAATTGGVLVSDVFRGFLIVGGYGGIAIIFWLGMRLMKLRALCLTALLASSFALMYWDQRSSFLRAEEIRYGKPGPPAYFSEFVRPGDVIYWPGNVERVWFSMHSASYAGGVQAIGIVFSERLAFEMLRRLKRVAQIGLPDEYFLSRNLSEEIRLTLALEQLPPLERRNIRLWDRSAISRSSAITPTVVEYLCKDSTLDWVIGLDNARGHPVAVAEIPDERKGMVRHALYDCRSLRIAVSSAKG